MVHRMIMKNIINIEVVFYKDISYYVFINKDINHLMYELEQEEKQIISALEYELEVSK